MAGPLSHIGRISSTRRRIAFAALVAGVLAVHGWLAEQLRDHIEAFQAASTMPPRIEVVYLRELELAPPPVAAPAPPVVAPAPKRRVRAPRPAASAPEPVVVRVEPDPLPTPPPEPLPMAELPALLSPEPVAPVPEVAVAAASAPVPAASAAEPFDWPASTRLSYKLAGNVRGEVHGDAQVEWIRQGSRYQVHLDITVGMPVAPLITRRMSSDGELTEQGLAPRRYDEDTKLLFRDPRRLTMLFEPGAIVMPNGQRRARAGGVQDTASQFVQLSWLFSTKPELLRTGNTVDFTLALPKSVDRWVYDVLAREPVFTAFGAVEAFHLKPRRISRPGGELVAEVWFAPQLRYLPVRIRIEQDPETFIDLVLSRKPELAGP